MSTGVVVDRILESTPWKITYNDGERRIYMSRFEDDHSCVSLDIHWVYDIITFSTTISLERWLLTHLVSSSTNDEIVDEIMNEIEHNKHMQARMSEILRIELL